MSKNRESRYQAKEERTSIQVNMLLFPRSRKYEPRDPSVETDIGKKPICWADCDAFGNPIKEARSTVEMNMLLFPRPRKGEEIISASVFVERRAHPRG